MKKKNNYSSLKSSLKVNLRKKIKNEKYNNFLDDYTLLLSKPDEVYFESNLAYITFNDIDLDEGVHKIKLNINENDENIESIVDNYLKNNSMSIHLMMKSEVDKSYFDDKFLLSMEV